MSKNGKILIITTLVIAIFGVVMIYSASHEVAGWHYCVKQAVSLVAGVGGMVGLMFVNPKFYRKFSLVAYIVGIVVLILVFVPGLSTTSYGATRWIRLGFISIQPSEIAKFCLVIFLANYVCKYDITNKPWRLVLALFLGGIYCLLIMIEPNMSITICMGVTMLFMLFVGGARLKFFGLISIPLVALAVLLVIIEPYRLSRIVAFLDPWQNPLTEGYQLIQSLYAISSGGVFGVGLFHSRQAHKFLPFAESDFIFSVIVEELGLFGGVMLIALFALMIVQIFKIAHRAKDKFSSLVCMGIGALIFFQVAINIAVVTGSIPPTGIPLPFVSAGGTSLLVFMSAIGIVLAVDRQSRREVNFSKSNVMKQNFTR